MWEAPDPVKMSPVLYREFGKIRSGFWGANNAEVVAVYVIGFSLVLARTQQARSYEHCQQDHDERQGKS